MAQLPISTGCPTPLPITSSLLACDNGDCYPLQIRESLVELDRLFAEFELRSVITVLTVEMHAIVYYVNWLLLGLMDVTETSAIRNICQVINN